MPQYLALVCQSWSCKHLDRRCKDAVVFHPKGSTREEAIASIEEEWVGVADDDDYSHIQLFEVVEVTNPKRVRK